MNYDTTSYREMLSDDDKTSEFLVFSSQGIGHQAVHGLSVTSVPVPSAQLFRLAEQQSVPETAQ